MTQKLHLLDIADGYAVIDDSFGGRTDNASEDQPRDARGRWMSEYRPAISLFKPDEVKAAKALGHLESGKQMVHPEDVKAIRAAVRRGERGSVQPVSKQDRQRVMDAFKRLDVKGHNQVSVADLRDELKHPRFEEIVQDLRERGVLHGAGAEGRVGTAEEKRRLKEGQLADGTAYLMTRNELDADGWAQ